MIRKILSFTIQNKNFVMFLTSMIYVIGLFAYFSDNSVIPCAILSVLGIFAVVKNYISPKLVVFWLFMFYFAFFNASLRIKNTDALFSIAPSDVVLTGQVATIPNSNVNNKTKFFFNVDNVDGKELKAKTLVTIYDDGGDFSGFDIGDEYKISGKLRPPFVAGNPSQFDYGKYLRNFGAHTLVYASKADCSPIDKKLSPKWSFLQTLNNLRNEIIETHSKYLKSPNIEILGGVVFGDDAVAPPDYIKTAFVNSGLLHILAASGMNVAFIYGFWFFFLNKFRVPFKIIVVSGIGVVVLYSMMTGLGPSVIRAALMLIFILLGKLIDRDAHSVSLLSLVGLLMLIYNPAYVNDVGFQLSFIVTFGILITAPAVLERFKKLPNWLSAAIFIPLVAQIWVMPIQMFYFNTVSLYSLFANISIMPFLSVISFGGFVSSVLAMIKPIASPVCYVFDLVLNPLLNILVWISTFFSSLPNSLIYTAHPSVYQILLYYAIILLLTLWFRIGFDKRIVVPLGILLVALILSNVHINNKKLEIMAFDVQNADSFLIKTPSEKYFIIDTAKNGYKGTSSQAKVIIVKYLRDNGIKDIEGMIITHFDSDHSGGAVDLMNNLNTKNVYINSYNDDSQISKKIYSTLKTKNIKTILAKDNAVIYQEPDFKVKTFHAGLKGEDVDNENSIITLVSYKDFDMLFMGDAGIVGFDRIKNNLPHNVEVLKVGHHGARNVVNKEMLEHLTPSVSIVSTGQNIYGHPNPVTIEMLNKTKVFRTDKQNSVKLISDGDKYEVRSFSKEKRQYIRKLLASCLAAPR